MEGYSASLGSCERDPGSIPGTSVKISSFNIAVRAVVKK